MRELLVFDKPRLPHAVADFIYKCSAEAIAARGKFTVAFSGGSLPAIVCTGLMEAETPCDYSKWHVFWADERCVPLDHEDSNYKAVTEMLLEKVNVPPEQVYAIDGDLIDDPEQAAEDYAVKLGQVFGQGVPSFDLLLLGMGPDGHTCSLFPGHELLDECDAFVSPIMDSPKPPSNRITLTYPVVNNSKRVAFVATGDSKTPALKDIFSRPTPGVLPSSRVSCLIGNVKFFVDEAAVGSMTIPAQQLEAVDFDAPDLAVFKQEMMSYKTQNAKTRGIENIFSDFLETEAPALTASEIIPEEYENMHEDLPMTEADIEQALEVQSSSRHVQELQDLFRQAKASQPSWTNELSDLEDRLNPIAGVLENHTLGEDDENIKQIVIQCAMKPVQEMFNSDVAVALEQSQEDSNRSLEQVESVQEEINDARSELNVGLSLKLEKKQQGALDQGLKFFEKQLDVVERGQINVLPEKSAHEALFFKHGLEHQNEAGRCEETLKELNARFARAYGKYQFTKERYAENQELLGGFKEDDARQRQEFKDALEELLSNEMAREARFAQRMLEAEEAASEMLQASEKIIELEATFQRKRVVVQFIKTQHEVGQEVNQKASKLVDHALSCVRERLENRLTRLKENEEDTRQRYCEAYTKRYALIRRRLHHHEQSIAAIEVEKRELQHEAEKAVRHMREDMAEEKKAALKAREAELLQRQEEMEDDREAVLLGEDKAREIFERTGVPWPKEQVDQKLRLEEIEYLEKDKKFLMLTGSERERVDDAVLTLKAEAEAWTNNQMLLAGAEEEDGNTWNDDVAKLKAQLSSLGVQAKMAPPPPKRDQATELKLEENLDSLSILGYDDRDVNIRVLEHFNGNLVKATSWLYNNDGDLSQLK